MKLLWAVPFFAFVQLNSAGAFSGLVVSEQGEVQQVYVPLEKLLPTKADLFHDPKILGAAKTLGGDLPEQIFWGVSAGVKGGVAGILRAGVRGGFSLSYMRISP